MMMNGRLLRSSCRSLLWRSRSFFTPPAYQRRDGGFLQRDPTKRALQLAQNYQELQGTALQLLQTYHNKLSKLSNDKHDDNHVSSNDNTLDKVCRFQERLHHLDTTPTWSQLQDTEATFRNTCRVLQRLLSIATRSATDSNPVTAAALLQLWVQLISHRARLVQQLQQQQQQQQQQSSSWSNWVSRLFSNQEPVSTNTTLGVTAHEDDTYAPTLAQWKYIFNKWDPDSMEAQADQWLQLWQLSNQQPQLFESVLQGMARCGTMERAQQAETLWRQQVQLHNDASSSFAWLLLVLKAYLSVVTSTPTSLAATREQAAWQVERLVRDHAPHQPEAVALALKAVAHSPPQQRCQRAEQFVQTCLGDQLLRHFQNPTTTKPIYQRPWSGPEWHVWQQLVAVYATEGRLEQVEAVLQCLQQQYQQQQQQQQHSSSLEPKSTKRPNRNHKQQQQQQQQHDATINWLETYRSIIVGIRRYTFEIETKGESPQDPSVLDLALYATGLLDRMAELGVSPDLDIMERLLKVWIRVESKQSGQEAQALLEKLQLREIYDPAFQVTKDTYSSVFRCWRTSAEQDHQEAPERAFLLLRSMEAQSGLGTSSLPMDESLLTNAEREIRDKVYNAKAMPDVRIYNTVLQTCCRLRRTADASKREKAVEIALNVYRRIQRSGLKPTPSTYRHLANCIATHLARDDPRRVELGKEILEAAWSMGGAIADREFAKSIKSLDRNLYSEYILQQEKGRTFVKSN